MQGETGRGVHSIFHPAMFSPRQMGEGVIRIEGKMLHLRGLGRSERQRAERIGVACARAWSTGPKRQKAQLDREG
jgi:hypothetical protein